eukprot:IDg19163t1
MVFVSTWRGGLSWRNAACRASGIGGGGVLVRLVRGGTCAWGRNSTKTL